MENSNFKKIIGLRINTLLADQKVSQKALAEELGVLPNVISYFCKGTRTPNTEQIIKIAKFFNVSTDYLLGLTDVKSTNTSIKDICEYTGLNEKSIYRISKLTSAPKGEELLKCNNFELDTTALELSVKTLNDIICSGFFIDFVFGIRDLQILTEDLKKHTDKCLPHLEKSISVEKSQDELDTLKAILSDCINEFSDIEKEILVKRYYISKMVDWFMYDVCNEEYIINSKGKFNDLSYLLYDMRNKLEKD